MTAAASHEERMLVDGKLVESDTGRTFDNINPATEEVLGRWPTARTADMHRAIDGARRAFDETDWSTNHELRKRCLPNCRTRSRRTVKSCARSSSSRWAARA